MSPHLNVSPRPIVQGALLFSNKFKFLRKPDQKVLKSLKSLKKFLKSLSFNSFKSFKFDGFQSEIV